MFKSIISIFKSKPNPKVYKLLSQGNLMVSRLNEESNIPDAEVNSILKKDFKSFEDELFSTFRGLLILSKRIEDRKRQDNTFPEWFETRMERTSNHLFSIFNYLKLEHYNELERYIIDFYKEPTKNDKVFDIRDKLRSYSITDNAVVS